MKERYPEWEREARGLLESFRATFDFWSDAREFVELVDQLKSLSPEFRRWWKEHGIRLQPSGEKLMRRSGLGLVRMSYATFQCTTIPTSGSSPMASPSRFAADPTASPIRSITPLDDPARKTRAEA